MKGMVQVFHTFKDKCVLQVPSEIRTIALGKQYDGRSVAWVLLIISKTIVFEMISKTRRHVTVSFEWRLFTPRNDVSIGTHDIDFWN